MQETRVRSLVQEDPTCRGETKPMRHNYWACALEPGNCNCWAHTQQPPKAKQLRASALQREKPPQWEAHVPKWRPSAAERKKEGEKEEREGTAPLKKGAKVMNGGWSALPLATPFTSSAMPVTTTPTAWTNYACTPPITGTRRPWSSTR